MDIQVAKLREVLGLLKPVVPRKSSLPILTNVLLGNGQAVATDLETMVIIPVPEADDSFLLPYADVISMLQFTQGGETLHIEKKDGNVIMSWSEGKNSFPSKDAKEFPLLAEFVPVAEASLDGDILIPAMVSVLPYAATETNRPVLNGVTLEMGEPFQVVAGDGFRMAYQIVPLSFPKNVTAIVRLGSVGILNHLWEKTPRTPPSSSDSLIPVLMAKKQVSVAFDGKERLKFVFGKAATAVIKLVEGSPPAWLKLIPKGEPVLQSQVMASELQLAVRRVLKVAKGGSNIIRMVFDDSTVTISAAGDGQKIESQVRALSIKGAPNRVGLNANYLLDYLNGKEGIVTITWTGKAPVMFQHQKNPRVLIMPMRVDWETPMPGESQPEAEAAPPTPPPAAEKPSKKTKAPPEPSSKHVATTKKKSPPAKSSKNRGSKKKT